MYKDAEYLKPQRGPQRWPRMSLPDTGITIAVWEKYLWFAKAWQGSGSGKNRAFCPHHCAGNTPTAQINFITLWNYDFRKHRLDEKQLSQINDYVKCESNIKCI